MRKHISVPRVAALVLGGAVVAVSGSASAANCPTGTNVVYVSGSSAFQTVLAAAQNVLGSTVTIVYQKPGSCEGLGSLLGFSGAAPVNDTSGGNTLALTGAGTTGSPYVVTATGCAVPSAGVAVDVGISDVYTASCQAGYQSTLNSLTSSQKDYLGPVQAMDIAVPTASTATSISAQAGYMVFKYAADTTAHTVAPWTIPADVFTRFYDSGTLQMIGAALGDGTKTLPGGLWKNAQCSTPGTTACPNTTSGTGGEVTALKTAATASTADGNAAVGIVSDQSIATGIRALAFQRAGQSCGYFPDSAQGNHDKLNVREGRYAIWGPEHLVVNMSGGQPVGMNSNTAAVQALIATLTATANAPAASSSDAGTSLTDAQIGSIIDVIASPASGVVPTCAMKVSRTSEVGPEASFSPPAACSCRFLTAATGTAPSTCTTCTSNSQCSGSTPACRFGYCEVQ
jgi:hypothetical protein